MRKCLFLFLLLSNSIFATDLSSLNVLSKIESNSIKLFVKTENSVFHKNLSCPMKSKSLASVLAQAATIRKLFKNSDCMQDETEIDHLVGNLNSISNVYTDNSTSIGGSNSSSNPMTSQINGQEITAVFDNLNNIFYKSKCTLKNKGLINYTADLVQSFSQMSLLMPNSNGLIVAGGGLALSAILRLVSSLFEADFEFKNSDDRKNFIKLNCSFFDLRRNVENSGLKEIQTTEHIKLANKISEMDKSLKEKLKLLQSSEEELLLKIENDRKIFFQNQIGNKSKYLNVLTPFKIAFEQSLKSVKNYDIFELKNSQVWYYDKNIENLKNVLKDYFSVNDNQDFLFDGDLKSIINISSRELYLMDNNSHEKVRVRLLFHLNRVIQDIENKAIHLNQKYLEKMKNGISVAKLIVKIKNISNLKRKELDSLISSLAPINSRLDNISQNEKDYSYLDEGTEKEVSLQEEFNKIREKIYGKWGNRFLEYVIDNAKRKNDIFSKKFKIFFNDHLGDGSKSDIKIKDDSFKLKEIFLCQDVRPLRDLWKGAKNLIEDGYDFVITNQSLFHKDLEKGFSGSGSHKEDIQDHYKSAIVAKKFLKMGSIPKEYQKYINQNAVKNNMLGAIMIKIENNKKKAQILQNLIKSRNCTDKGFN